MDIYIILGAGKGSRAGLGFNKLLCRMDGCTVLDKTISRFNGLGRTVVVASQADFALLKAEYPHLEIVIGGETRSGSVRNALRYLQETDASPASIVAIHDGARPFVTLPVIQRAMDSARKAGSGIPCMPVLESVAQGNGGKLTDHLDRSQLVALQTPQCFNLGQLWEAYKKVDGDYSDDSQVYRLAGYPPTMTEGDACNIKLTTAADFAKLSASPAVLSGEPAMLNGEHAVLNGEPLKSDSADVIGTGFDVHRLVSGRRLVLGGVTIPHDKGLLGHSDADVLAHAITDCVLSAAGSPDIGVLFKDTDAAYKDIDSLILLDKALCLLKESGKRVVSVSCVIIAQQPKLAPFIDEMRSVLADRLGINKSDINISATTTEFLGLIGQGEAIAASATALFKTQTD